VSDLRQHSRWPKFVLCEFFLLKDVLVKLIATVLTLWWIHVTRCQCTEQHKVMSNTVWWCVGYGIKFWAALWRRGKQSDASRRGWAGLLVMPDHVVVRTGQVVSRAVSVRPGFSSPFSEASDRLPHARSTDEVCELGNYGFWFTLLSRGYRAWPRD